MAQSGLQPTRRFRGKLTRTSLLLLLPLALIPVAILGVVTSYNTDNFLREQAISQFIDVGDKQGELIFDTVKSRENFLLTISEDSTFRVAIDNLLNNPPGSENFQDIRRSILNNYERINRTQNETVFNYFLVVSTDKEILFSTYPLWEKKILDQAIYDEILFKSASVGLYNIYPFHTEAFNDRFMVFSTQRLYDSFGNHTGTLLGITAQYPFQRVLELGTLSYADARPYYITKPNQEGVFVGLSPDSEDLAVFEPSSDHINIVFPKIQSTDPEGVLEFASFDDEPVLAYIKWLPSIETALVIEVPQSVIAEPLQRIISIQILLFVIALFVLGLIIWQGTKRIVQPILDVSRTAQHFADGDMQARALVNRNDEIGLLAYSFNQVADQLVTLYRSLESLVEARTQQIRTAAEVAQLITSASSLDEMLSRTVNLIVDRFSYYHAAIYLIDRTGDHAIMREAAGHAAQEIISQAFRLAVGSRSIVGTVSATNQPWIAHDVKQDPYYMEHELLPETQSEAVIPLSIGGRVLGVLDVQSNQLNAFDEEEITTLQTLAGQIASAIQNVRLLENIQIDLQSANLLYLTSHKLADATSLAEVLQTLREVLREMPFISSLFEFKGDQLKTLGVFAAGRPVQDRELVISITKEAIDQIVASLSWDIISVDGPPESLIQDLIDFAMEIGCQAFTLIPLLIGDRLVGMILLGSANPNSLTPVNLQPINSIAEMSNTTIEKIEAIEAITNNLAELQSLSTISDAISMETELNDLFAILHRQITQAFGDINFLIALYNMETQLIEIPYMDDDGEIVSIPSFPLGQGLTSIVIRTQQPLMIVEDTVNRARALGAIVTSDRPALSWLGVPMLVAGEVVGALVVQDTNEEHRFDEKDLRLLTTLAGQVAPTVRNTRLLAEAQEAAERDRQLYQVTDRIRRANSIQEILETTTQELSQVLKLKKATINIITDPVEVENRDNGSEEKPE